MNIEVYDHFDAIGVEAWDALAARSPTQTIFQTFAWQRAWWRAYGESPSPLEPRQALSLVAGYEDGHLRVILPLVRRGKSCYFAGDGVADRMDILYDARRPDDLMAFLLFLRASPDWQLIELAGIPDASPTWHCLKSLVRAGGFFLLTVHKTPSWSLMIQGREARVSRHLETGVLAKHAAVFASRGNVHVSHRRAPCVDAATWESFFTQHIYRWSSTSQPSMFVTRAARDMCRHMAADPLLCAQMVLTTVYLNGQPAAYHLGFIYDGRFFWYAASFDIAFRRFCPDDVLWREVVAFAQAQGCREVVFTSSQEPAVRRFADSSGALRCVRVFRSRREEWLARGARLAVRLPLAMQLFKAAVALVQTLQVLVSCRRMVKRARLKMEGVESFEELYLQCPGEGKRDLSLARPEAEIIRRLRPELKDMAMLDIGVGFGRTSVYFAPAVKRYDAFDSVASMVAVARADLDDLKDCCHIVQDDAARIKTGADGVYDIILFSGNGLDESPWDVRLQILREVRRVGREGAWFFFSSRNLQGLTLKASRGMLDLLSRCRRQAMMGAANKGLRRSCAQESAYLLDESGGYRLPVYYGTPKEEVRVLKELGFHDVRVFSGRTGLEVRDWRRWARLADESLYYSCRV